VLWAGCSALALSPMGSAITGFKAAALLSTPTIPPPLLHHTYNICRLQPLTQTRPDNKTRILHPDRANTDIRLQARSWPNVCSKVVAPAARDSHSSSLCFWVSSDLISELWKEIY
jgi:hypothetical protein